MRIHALATFGRPAQQVGVRGSAQRCLTLSRVCPSPALRATSAAHGCANAVEYMDVRERLPKER